MCAGLALIAHCPDWAGLILILVGAFAEHRESEAKP
jgi:hypothetical protein